MWRFGKILMQLLSMWHTLYCNSSVNFTFLFQLHAANAGIHTEKLENLRISIAKGSPMWETLDLCIKVVDVESLDQLVPRLAQLVRSGVGLNTRFVVVPL